MNAIEAENLKWQYQDSTWERISVGVDIQGQITQPTFYFRIEGDNTQYVEQKTHLSVKIICISTDFWAPES